MRFKRIPLCINQDVWAEETRRGRIPS